MEDDWNIQEPSNYMLVEVGKLHLIEIRKSIEDTDTKLNMMFNQIDILASKKDELRVMKDNIIKSTNNVLDMNFLELNTKTELVSKLNQLLLKVNLLSKMPEPIHPCKKLTTICCQFMIFMLLILVLSLGLIVPYIINLYLS